MSETQDQRPDPAPAGLSRRNFLGSLGLGAAASAIELSAPGAASAAVPELQALGPISPQARREAARKMRVDMARLAKSIDQIALTYDFKNRPKPEDIFTDQYLPAAAERKL